MTKSEKRVPVRITMWLPNGMVVDSRAWMDTFDMKNEVKEARSYGTHKVWKPTGRKDFTVKAHTSGDDRPWKFYRGKPVVP